MSDLQTIHKNCREIFLKGFFETNEQGELQVHGQSRACKVYQTLTDGDESRQDCIGENFNQLIQKVKDNWFARDAHWDLDYYFFTYIFWLYLFVERYEIIFEVINRDGKSKLFNDFKQHNFKTLLKITKWANFIKHPKEFLFTHWPQYYVESEPGIKLKKGDLKIDTAFIFKHYTSEKNERPVVLENNSSVFVEIPNLESLTSDFCKEMNIFFDFICCNKVVADFLKKKSTIENHYYYEDEDVSSDTIVPSTDIHTT
ncbi:hypothetical protein [Paraflavitalea sp. CAU 1676]|uniref:hypothetical protein n=1 Tax=Paraflavitalea sp. CAU 1676 TaxID=3032598 RepID=UPI0023DB0501|nr:hypothetical protein [Paraflavitalea sp. CAU 1676]MDF2188697.1 hypothetical protein [Paraflavitalea sp. CAU 1676]